MTRPLQLAEQVLRLAEKLSPAPWNDLAVQDGEVKTIGWFGSDLTDRVCMPVARIRKPEDAAFIALSRTAAPLLAQRVIELEKAVSAVVAADDWVNGETPEGGIELMEAVKERKAKIAALRSLLADAGGGASP